MPSSPPRCCSTCDAPLQAFFARDVEVDRCPDCGGIWFDMGELQRVSRRMLTLNRQPASTTPPSCPRCRVGLCPAQLAEAGALAVEACPRCLGVWLEAGALEQVARRQVALTPAADASLGFVCIGCGGRFSRAEGQHLRGGLGCRRCAARAQEGDVERRTAHTPPSGEGFFDWDDLLDVLSLFD